MRNAPLSEEKSILIVLPYVLPDDSCGHQESNRRLEKLEMRNLNFGGSDLSIVTQRKRIPTFPLSQSREGNGGKMGSSYEEYKKKG